MTNPTYELLKEANQLRKASHLEEEYYGPLIIELTEALESVLEGLYKVYVNLGEDTDGARNARELFGPWVGFDPETHIPEIAAAFRKQWEDDYDIDLARAWNEGHRKGIRWNRGDSPGNPYQKEES